MKDREDPIQPQPEPEPGFDYDSNEEVVAPDPPPDEPPWPEATESTPEEDAQALGETVPMAKPWYITPLKLPEEVRAGIEEAITKQGIPLTEYVVHWMMYGAGYDHESIIATRKLCYPDSGLQPIRRGD